MAAVATINQIKELESTLNALRKIWKEKSQKYGVIFVTPKDEKLRFSFYERSTIQDVYEEIPSNKREKYIVFKGKAAPIDSAKATLKELGITKAYSIVLTSHSGYFNIELPHPSVLKGEEKSSKEPTNLALSISPFMTKTDLRKAIAESYSKIFSDYLEKNKLDAKVELIGFESPNADCIYSKDGEKKLKKMIKFSVSPKLGDTDKWNLSIKTLTGKTLKVDIMSSMTVIDLKNAIQDVEGIPPDQQRLIQAGKVLEDIDFLSEVVKPSDPLHLILRLRGGMYQESSGKVGFENIDHEFFTLTHPPYHGALAGKNILSFSEDDMYKVIIKLENDLRYMKMQLK